MPTTVFCLHYLGGSAQTFKEVAGRLEGKRVIALDLPGFGLHRDALGFSVSQMADAVIAQIRFHAPDEWLLVGHSMGAKVAAVIARRAEDGAAGLSGLVGLVSLAGSPPGPEPMDDSKRQVMLGWFQGDKMACRREAQFYVEQNVAAPLPTELAALAVEDVLRASVAAWRAWLTSGSREDCSRSVAVLRTPALIVAGAVDDALGEQAQRQHAVPHFARVQVINLAETGHLLPLERPQAVAELIQRHGESIARIV